MKLFVGRINSGDISRPLGFVPDSTLINHVIRLSRTFGSTAVAAGYGMSRLEQDSFTAPQTVAGYTTGKIVTDNASIPTIASHLRWGWKAASSISTATTSILPGYRSQRRRDRPNVLISQCLDRRIGNKEELREEVAAWQARRDQIHAKVNWQFTTEDARVKFNRLYPIFEI